MADAIKKEVDEIGEEFLRLEKYVNLNYTGFHKILKKHDRWLTNPCRTFYLQRLQNHNWTRGDYSDVVRGHARGVLGIRNVAPSHPPTLPGRLPLPSSHPIHPNHNTNKHKHH